MGRRGPLPKPADQRVRKAKEAPSTTLPLVRAPQPKLPPRMPDGSAWPARTRAWWRRWAKDPRSTRFDAAAWDDLLDTAAVHGAVWSGDVRLAAELRLRVAKYGVTPEDRARLRIHLDDGLEHPVEAPTRTLDGSRARARLGNLRVVSGVDRRGGA